MSQAFNLLSLKVERGTSSSADDAVGGTSRSLVLDPYTSAAIQLAVLNAAVVTTAACFPALREQFLVEDGYLESLTAVIFAAAAVVGFVTYFRAQRRCRWYVLVPVFAALGFLEETSYGERLFHWQMPSSGGIKLDAIHDVIQLSYESMKRVGVDKWQMAMTMLACGLVCLLWMRCRGGQLWRLGVRLLQHRPLAMLATSLLLCVMAVVFDLKVGSQLLRTFEEFAEFNAASLLVCAACRAGQPSPQAAA